MHKGVRGKRHGVMGRECRLGLRTKFIVILPFIAVTIKSSFLPRTKKALFFLA